MVKKTKAVEVMKTTTTTKPGTRDLEKSAMEKKKKNNNKQQQEEQVEGVAAAEDTANVPAPPLLQESVVGKRKGSKKLVKKKSEENIEVAEVTNEANTESALDEKNDDKKKKKAADDGKRADKKKKKDEDEEEKKATDAELVEILRVLQAQGRLKSLLKRAKPEDESEDDDDENNNNDSEEDDDEDDDYSSDSDDDDESDSDQSEYSDHDSDDPGSDEDADSDDDADDEDDAGGKRKQPTKKKKMKWQEALVDLVAQQTKTTMSLNNGMQALLHGQRVQTIKTQQQVGRDTAALAPKMLDGSSPEKVLEWIEDTERQKSILEANGIFGTEPKLFLMINPKYREIVVRKLGKKVKQMSNRRFLDLFLRKIVVRSSDRAYKWIERQRLYDEEGETTEEKVGNFEVRVRRMFAMMKNVRHVTEKEVTRRVSFCFGPTLAEVAKNARCYTLDDLFTLLTDNLDPDDAKENIRNEVDERARVGHRHNSKNSNKQRDDQKEENVMAVKKERRPKKKQRVERVFVLSNGNNNNNGGCHLCGKAGHFARDCYSNNSNRSNNNSNTLNCNSCGKPGHFARDCRGPKPFYNSNRGMSHPRFNYRVNNGNNNNNGGGGGGFRSNNRSSGGFGGPRRGRGGAQYRGRGRRGRS